MKITIKVDKYQDLEVYKFKPASCTYCADRKELTFDANIADGKDYRLVSNGNKFIALIKGQGTTITIRDIFIGTEEECLQEMERQGWDAKWQD